MATQWPIRVAGFSFAESKQYIQKCNILILLMVFRYLLELRLQCVRFALEGKCVEVVDKKQMLSCYSWMRMRWKVRCSALLGGRCL